MDLNEWLARHDQSKYAGLFAQHATPVQATRTQLPQILDPLGSPGLKVKVISFEGVRVLRQSARPQPLPHGLHGFPERISSASC
jgi:hypothetical protein